MKFSTKAIRAGQNPETGTGAVVVPIYQTSTFIQEEINKHKGYEYSRLGNPTRQALEDCLAALEEGNHALCFSSGLAAENAVLTMLRPGDHVVAIKDMYGGTYRLFEDIFRPYGITFSYVGNLGNDFRNALTPSTRLIWLESPTNPLLGLVDIAEVAAYASGRGIKVVVDNTFASPYFQRPLTLGADIVLHSTTKYIGGHSDVIGGALVMKDQELFDKLRFIQNAAGAVPGAFDCWLTLRGIKTLAVRMKQHEVNALAIAEFLNNHPRVTDVFYPGLPGNRFHALAGKQMTGFGGMLSFRLRDGNEAMANSFFKKLKVILLAESLGGVESLICYPYAMTHASMTDEQKANAGVTRDLIRLSVGIEDTEDLIADLADALA
ncbi:MAG: cystathionine gamma-synthase [Bacteroidales bacterium]